MFRGHIHHAIPVCESGHKTPASHLHDSRYNPDDCSVCAFLFAVTELVPVSTCIHPPKLQLVRSLPMASQTFTVLEHSTTLLRGPPAATSTRV